MSTVSSKVAAIQGNLPRGVDHGTDLSLTAVDDGQGIGSLDKEDKKTKADATTPKPDIKTRAANEQYQQYEQEVKTRIEASRDPQATDSIPDYSAKHILTILNTYQIPGGPKKAKLVPTVLADIKENEEEINIKNEDLSNHREETREDEKVSADSQEADNKDSKDKKEKKEINDNMAIYFYARETLSDDFLLEDQVIYFLAHFNNKTLLEANRRIAILYKDATGKGGAFVIQLEGFNKDVIKKIAELILSNPQINLQNAFQEMLKDSAFRAEIKKLYDKITVMLFSQEIAEKRMVFTLCKKSYAKQPKFLAVKPSENGHGNILLTQNIIDVLLTGETSKAVDLKILFEKHNAMLCQNIKRSLIIKLSSLSKEDSTAIELNLTILHKYLQIFSNIHELVSKIKPDTWLIDLEEALDQHKRVKQNIYRKSYSLKQVLKPMDLSRVLSLYSALHDPLTLKGQLRDQCRELFHEIKKAEEKISDIINDRLQLWSNYLKYNLFKTSRFVYRTTLMSMFGNLFQWITGSEVFFDQVIAIDNKYLKEKQWKVGLELEKACKTALQVEKLEEDVQKKVWDFVNHWISVKGLSYGIGAVAGGLITSFLGSPYAMFRIIALRYITQNIYNLINEVCTNDRRAEMRKIFNDEQNRSGQLTGQLSFLAAQLLLTPTEYLVTQDIRYVIKGIGSALFGVMSVLAAERYIPKLHELEELTERHSKELSQASNPGLRQELQKDFEKDSTRLVDTLGYIKLLIFFIGDMLGYMLIDLALETYDQLKFISSFLQLMKEEISTKYSKHYQFQEFLFEKHEQLNMRNLTVKLPFPESRELLTLKSIRQLFQLKGSEAPEGPVRETINFITSDNNPVFVGWHYPDSSVRQEALCYLQRPTASSATMGGATEFRCRVGTKTLEFRMD